MDETSRSAQELQRELAYYKKKLDELSGESIRHDYALSALRYELKQKHDAFGILTRLQKEFSVATPLFEIYTKTVQAIIAFLGMDRSIVLTRCAENDLFTASHWYGYPNNQFTMLGHRTLHVPGDQLTTGFFLLVNKKAEPDAFGKCLQQMFALNYFVGVPVYNDNTPIALLLAGRQVEKVPFYQPLNKSDVDTLLAIASLIGTVLQNKKLLELRAEMMKQKEENALVSNMLAELKATQAQLVQREKMASLGELTAGIAHEIQNPLNFVNNFSEISKELVEELRQEAENGNITATIALVGDVLSNLDKVVHHGKRADSIVKGMLQHARANAGKKEPTNINLLADEYLRLCYQGMRAKNKSFATAIDTHFDQTVNAINIVPQDIGRVLLNLFSNAFYAVSEKEKYLRGQYDPKVEVRTLREGDHVLIIVKDNGTGMPPKVAEKVFQPFFTTKPTGEGTGLGLSLSYDIVTKGHGGTLSVHSTEGEGSEFTVKLPLAK